MKKILVIGLVMAASTTYAQHFDIGVKGGVNISSFLGSSNAPIVTSSTYVGFHAGILTDLYFGNHFALQPELLFSTQGVKIDNDGRKDDYKVSYLAVPIMAHYRFTGGFYAEAGPQFSFRLNETYQGTNANFAKSTDLSLGAGIGYHSPIGLGVGARYLVGLSKVGDFNFSSVQPSWRYGVVQVSVFYTFFNGQHKY
jgi:hypothetical protein